MKLQKVTAFILITGTAMSTLAPAFAATAVSEPTVRPQYSSDNTVGDMSGSTEGRETAYMVSYSQIEQLVLDNNLQVENNDLTMDNLIDEDDLKKQYQKIYDSIHQTSATLMSVVANPSAQQDLKTVAIGTSASLAVLQSLFESQEDASEDTIDLAEVQIKQANNQIVKATQSLFTTYYQMQYNLVQMKNNRSSLEDAVQAAQTRYQLGMGTAVAVEDAKASLASLKSNITQMQDQSLTIKYQMNQLLGHPYNDRIVFGKMPQPDITYIEAINLEKDVEEAQKENYNIQVKKLQRSIMNDDTRQEKDQRKAKSNEIDAEMQKISASLAAQFNTVKQQQLTLELKQKDLDTAKLKQDQAQKQYDLGLISSVQLNQIKSACLNQESLVETAKSTLFWNIESYKWLVKGLPAS